MTTIQGDDEGTEAEIYESCNPGLVCLTVRDRSVTASVMVRFTKEQAIQVAHAIDPGRVEFEEYAERRYAQLRGALDIMAAEIERLKAANADAHVNVRKNLLAEMTDRANLLFAKNEYLDSEVRALNLLLKQSNHDRDTARAANEPILEEAREWKTRAQLVPEETRSLRSQALGLVLERDSLRAQVQGLTNERDAAKEEARGWKGQFQRKASDLETCEAALDTERREHKDLEAYQKETTRLMAKVSEHYEALMCARARIKILDGRAFRARVLLLQDGEEAK